MAGCEALAVVGLHREAEGEFPAIWELRIAGECFDAAWTDLDKAEMERWADRINAAVEAIVEARLDEITKGAN